MPCTVWRSAANFFCNQQQSLHFQWQLSLLKRHGELHSGCVQGQAVVSSVTPPLRCVFLSSLTRHQTPIQSLCQWYPSHLKLAPVRQKHTRQFHCWWCSCQERGFQRYRQSHIKRTEWVFCRGCSWVSRRWWCQQSHCHSASLWFQHSWHLPDTFPFQTQTGGVCKVLSQFSRTANHWFFAAPRDTESYLRACCI